MEGYYTAIVSSTDAEKGLVKVLIPREQNTISDWLPCLKFEYNMPRVGARVAVILDKHGEGVCLGEIFSNEQTPPVSTGYAKDYDGVRVRSAAGQTTIEASGTLRLSASRIILDGYEGET